MSAKPNVETLNLSRWYAVASTNMDQVPIYPTFLCGMLDAEPEYQGSWVLTGVIKSRRYTPILDIYSDLTGHRTANHATFYQFQLRETE